MEKGEPRGQKKEGTVCGYAGESQKNAVQGTEIEKGPKGTNRPEKD